MEQNSVQVGCLGFCTVNHYDGWPSPKIRSLADLPWLPCFIKLTPGPKVKAGFSQIASCRRGGRGAWCFLAAPHVSQVLPKSISLMPGWTKAFLLVWYLCVSEYSGNKNVTLKLFFLDYVIYLHGTKGGWKMAREPSSHSRCSCHGHPKSTAAIPSGAPFRWLSICICVCTWVFFCIFKVESQHFLAPGIVYIDLLMVFVTLIPVSIFSATIYPQHLEQCLEHSMCSINIS